MQALRFVLSAVLGYLLGSISSAVILSRFKGKDIRTVGSGNAGATNILRTYGKGSAALVTLFDALKGVLAVLFGRMLCGEYGGYLGGFFAVLGHNFPLYFGFRGGKGIITSLAIMLSAAPVEAACALAVGVALIAIFRYVSLGSIVGALLFGVFSLLRSDDLWFQIFAASTSLLAIVRHHSNIRRLCSGTERKLGK